MDPIRLWDRDNGSRHRDSISLIQKGNSVGSCVHYSYMNTYVLRDLHTLIHGYLHTQGSLQYTECE